LDDLFVCFLHFAQKTSERTIDDPNDLASARLMMFSHTVILFSCGLRLSGPGGNCLTLMGGKPCRRHAAFA
jgi:hypothetical protein